MQHISIKKYIQNFSVIFLFCLLVGCDEKQDAKNILLVGTASEYPPFEFRENGKLTGFDIEIIKAFAEYSKMELKILEMEFNALIAALKGRKVDAVISAMNYTEERAREVGFSDNYYHSKPSLLIRKGDCIKNFRDLENKILGVQLGSLWEAMAVEKIQLIPSLKLHTLSKTPYLVEELKLGRIDAVITEHEQAVEYSKVNSSLAYYNLESSNIGYAAAFRKDSYLVQEFNSFLKQFEQSGNLKSLQQKWFK